MYELFCRTCGKIFKAKKINLGCPNCGATLFDVRAWPKPEPKRKRNRKPKQEPEPKPEPEKEPEKEN